FGLVTTTSTAPAAWAGVMAEIVPPLVTWTFVAAAPPTPTVAPGAKFAPRRATVVPPAVGPVFGLRLESKTAVEPPTFATKAAMPQRYVPCTALAVGKLLDCVWPAT